MTRVRLFADRDYQAFARIKGLAEQRDISITAARDENGYREIHTSTANQGSSR